MSSTMNALSALTWKELLEVRFKQASNERKAFITKVLGDSWETFTRHVNNKRTEYVNLKCFFFHVRTFPSPAIFIFHIQKHIQKNGFN